MRKKNSFFNLIGSFASYSIATIFAFLTQACLVRILGIEYNGINGLFTNIITMLSVAELGLATTIIFKLYKPLAGNDIEKIKSWMNFYKICYRYVALFIAIIGILIIPLVPLIVGNVSINENIIILYLITLLDTVLSYIMTYKRSILYADQKNYIINIFHIGYIIIMNISQILSLLLFKNYLLFLGVKLIYRIFENVMINQYVNKHYSYINDNYKKIKKEEKQDVFERIKAIFLQKISFVINKGIDNIVISIFLGIVSVGLYTNYYLVLSAILNIIYQLMSSLTASVGNLLTENNSEKNYSVYKKINMMNFFLTGVSSVGFACTINPLISFWVGAEYLLPINAVFSFALYIYSDSSRRAITIYKEAAGICKEDKYMYIIMASINLIFSILLCKLIGISGVILGTAFSYLFLIIYSYPKFIFKPIFQKEILLYHKENLKYVVFIIVSLLISYGITNIINTNNFILQFIINGIISILVTSIIFIILFYKTEEFKFYYNWIVRKNRKD